ARRELTADPRLAPRAPCKKPLRERARSAYSIAPTGAHADMRSSQRPVIAMESTMRLYAKQETEPIFATLERYRAELLEHPLLVAARTGQLERTTLLQFAFYQYSDSITWIPMLAQMKSRALRSRRLRAAIEDNIGHEAGIGGTSHVTLAARLMRSLGVHTLVA